MRTQPSPELKRTFQTVGLIATVLVVLIHYRSASTLGSGINGLAQEFIINGIARTAVPLFAFAAGFFYFLSATGTWQNYGQKLHQRIRTLAVPYLIVSALALTCWALLRQATGQPSQLSLQEWTSRIALHPMPEQLWFLRDLLLLVIIAPVIQWFVGRRPRLTLGLLMGCWFAEFQPAPVVAGWYVINIETLTFFTLGCYVVQHVSQLESLIRISARQLTAFACLWISLLAIRVAIDPQFDLWYTQQYTLLSLAFQKLAILAGCMTLLPASHIVNQRHQSAWFTWLCGCSFFVYLIHEFPLREVLLRISERLVGQAASFWLAAPSAIVLCFAAAALASRCTPWLLAVVTGNRTPSKA